MSLKMDEFDEDVTFENSVLGQHLQEVGLGDLGLEPALYQHQDLKADENLLSQELPAQQETPKNNGSKSVKKKSDNVAEMYRHEIWKLVQECKLLEDEDRILLEHTQPDWMQRKNSREQNMWWLPHLVSIGISGSLLTVPMNPVLSSQLPEVASVVTLCSAALLGLPACVHLCYKSWRHAQHKKQVVPLRQLLKHVTELSSVLKKAIRLVQEMELVARGFTIARLVGAADRLEQHKQSSSRQRQCPKLRARVFNTARDLVITLKEATCAMLTKAPLQETVGDTWNYLCQVPLGEYGACITEEDPDSLQQLTDNYSIAAMKAVVQLLQVHISEYLQRLALTAGWADDGLKIVSSSAEVMVSQVKQQTTDLTQSYKLHRDLMLEPEQCAKPTPEGSEIKPLYTAVHSLDLHLQAALRRSRDISSKLEQLANEKSIQDLSICNGLTAELQVIKADIEACKECWEDANSRLQSTHVQKGGKTEEASNEDAAPPATTDQNTPVPVALFEGEGPVIHDEVFEAYTDPTENDQADWDMDMLLSLEERERKKQAKQEAIRLVKELRSVIAVRAVEREERERKALQRSGKAEDSLDASQGDSSPQNERSGIAQPSDNINNEMELESQTNRADTSVDVKYDAKMKGFPTYPLLPHTDIQTNNEDTHLTDSLDDRQPGIDKDQSKSPVKLEWNSTAEGEGSENVMEDTNSDDETEKEDLLAKVQRLSGIPCGIPSGVAALAAAKSQTFGLQEDTIGDSSDEDEVDSDH